MKKVKEHGALALITLICFCIVGGSVLAEGRDSGRSSRIASRGVLDYENGKVVIDSADLLYLADQIDGLENAYKSATVDALNQIRTYYSSANGDISHDDRENNVPPESAAALSFDDLYKGILKSQSVEHLADVQAQDADGSLLYYADSDAGENNNLIMTTTDANDYPIMIRPAVASNLTGGTAAWVDGNLIIGNGADNKSYYDNGYKKGYDNGYNIGCDTGYNNGYNIGYNKGYADKTSDLASQQIKTIGFAYTHTDHQYGTSTGYITLTLYYNANGVISDAELSGFNGDDNVVGRAVLHNYYD